MTVAPLCIDLFCGLGGWTEGFLSEGWDVIGFDVEQHVYGEHRYPAQLVLQDVRTIHGSQFRHAQMIVASSPCQEFSYRAMPWSRAKALGPPELGMELFAQAARIQREASEAAGRYIPMIQENVRGAQKYVGRANWHYGSYYLWGDVPALMPIAQRAGKVSTMGADWYPPDHPKHVPGLGFNTHADRATRMLGDGIKAGDRNKGRAEGKHEWTTGFDKHDGSTKNTAHRQISAAWRDKHYDETAKAALATEPVIDEYAGTKGYPARLGQSTISRRHGSKSKARKAASARIAKIPFPLASHIARIYREAQSSSTTG